MKAKFIKSKYIIEEFNNFINNKIKIFNLINYIYIYIQSNIIKIFKINYIILIKILKIKDQIYIN